MHQEALDAFRRSLAELQKSDKYSDLKVFCGDEVFLVHKAIICPRSDFFDTACTWGKSGQPKGEISLDADDPRIVKLMIDYFYQFDYSDNIVWETQSEVKETISENNEMPLSGFDNNVSVDGIKESVETVIELEPEPEPDLQHIPEPEPERVPWDYMLNIKEKRTKERQMRADGTWTNRLTQDMIDEELAMGQYVDELMHGKQKARLQDLGERPNTNRLVVNAHLYALADKYCVQDLKSLAKAKFSNAVAQGWQSEAFVEAAQLVFANTPASDFGLRSVVIEALHNHQELMDYEEVQELLDSGNGIAWQLVKVLLPSRMLQWPTRRAA